MLLMLCGRRIDGRYSIISASETMKAFEEYRYSIASKYLNLK
jgi:hypothetical protein